MSLLEKIYEDSKRSIGSLLTFLFFFGVILLAWLFFGYATVCYYGGNGMLFKAVLLMIAMSTVIGALYALIRSLIAGFFGGALKCLIYLIVAFIASIILMIPGFIKVIG